jgi:hypothetical protein
MENQTDIGAMSATELESLAYRLFRQRTAIDADIRTLESRIEELRREEARKAREESEAKGSKERP